MNELQPQGAAARMYDLLPEILRARDVELGFPLKALLGIISEQAQVVEDDIQRLYENWFIETCDGWVVPYLGDLIGYSLSAEAAALSRPMTDREMDRMRLLIPRRDVANTIRHRQRSGTLSLLEDLAFDVAGWPGRAVEMAPLLAGSMSIDSLRRDRGGSIILHDLNLMNRLATPFSSIAHYLDVRTLHAIKHAGRYGLNKVALFVWRTHVWPIERGRAVRQRKPGARNRRYRLFRIDPLNRLLPLFTRSTPETELTSIAGELNLPLPIKRWMLAGNLSAYYGYQKSLMIWRSIEVQKRTVSEAGAGREYRMVPVPPEAIDVRKLHDPLDPMTKRPVSMAIGETAELPEFPVADRVAIDPEHGVLAFPWANAPARVEVTFHTSFPGQIGGGGYPRNARQLPEYTLRTVHSQQELESALAEFWVDATPETVARLDTHCREIVVEIENSATYRVPRALSIPEGYRLQIRSAAGQRPVLVTPQFRWHKKRRNGVLVSLHPGSRLTMDGLVVEGIRARPGGEFVPLPAFGADSPFQRISRLDRPTLILRHCTIPAPGRVVIRKLSADVRILTSIVGTIDVRKEQAESEPLALAIEDSILDPRDRRQSDAVDPRIDSIDYLRHPRRTRQPDEASEMFACPASLRIGRDDDNAHVIATLRRTTVLGDVFVQSIALAEDCIFCGKVDVNNPTNGCLRFCYVDPHSAGLLPARYQCQPEIAVEQLSASASQEERDDLASRIFPRFRSLRWGSPHYCQLSAACAEQIGRGASDGSEMGAFHDEFRPQREALLRARLSEHVPAETEAEVITAD